MIITLNHNRGGGGANPHMGNDRDVQTILNSAEMSDENIYRTLFHRYVDNSVRMGDRKNVELPTLSNSDWRYQTQIGAEIQFDNPDRPGVFANHFKVYFSLLDYP